MIRPSLIAITVLSVSACAVMEDQRPATDPSVPVLTATVETQAVSSTGDAADDPAIWVHPTDPAASLVIGTDKQAGLYVYDLEGQVKQYLAVPAPNNVDIRQSDAYDLAVTSNRGNNTVGVLLVNEAGVRKFGSFPTVRPEPYGICLGMTDKPLVAVTHKSGDVDLYTFEVTPDTPSTHLTSFTLGTQLEGCVFDEPNNALFVGKEEQGIVVYDLAETLAGNALPNDIDRVGSDNGIVGDIEGLTLYRTGETSGYLIASSQGNNTYAVYDRQSYAFLARFSLGSTETIDGAEETDGIDATSANLGPNFPNGMLAVQDGFNDGADTQNFKYIPWERIQTLIDQ